MKTLGVVIGRFQYARLTEAHKILIATAFKENDGLLVYVGSTPMWGTARNPLPPGLISSNLKTDIKNALILRGIFEDKTIYVHNLGDRYLNEVWLEQLRTRLAHDVLAFGALDKIRIYSGPDGICSFLKANGFSGVEFCELPEQGDTHATNLRDAIKPEHWDLDAFKAGMIYAQKHVKPKTFLAVDAIVYDPKNKTVLVGSKPSIYPFNCLIGGMVEATDATLEDAVKRELFEETGLVPDRINRLRGGPYRINDWRSKTEPVYTVPFEVHVEDAIDKAKPNDDISKCLALSVDDFRHAHTMLPQYAEVIEAWDRQTTPLNGADLIRMLKTKAE